MSAAHTAELIPTRPNCLVSAPSNLPAAWRRSLALQSVSPATASPISAQVDILLTLLPDTLAGTVAPADNVKTDTRDWLTVYPTITKNPDGALALDYGPAPEGLTAIESVLWPSLGRGCARASLFLASWLRKRRFREACEIAGVTTLEASAYRACSEVYTHLHDRIDTLIRADRHATAEDTLHALAQGEINKVKTVTDPSGGVTVTDEGPIYSERALALQLQAGDRARYGTQQAVAVAPVINISLSAPRPDGPVIEVEEAQPADTPDAKPRIEYFKP